MKYLKFASTQLALIKNSLFMLAALFVFNATSYLLVVAMGRMLSIKDFAILALVSSFFFILQIPGLALSNLTQRYTAYLSEKPSLTYVFSFTKKLMLVTTIVASLAFIASLTFLKEFFNLPNMQPLIWFLPTVLFTFLLSWYRSLLSGLRLFTILGISILIEGIIKILVGIGLVNLGFGLAGAILAFPISIAIAIIPAYIYLKRNQPKASKINDEQKSKLNKEFTSYYGFAFISSLGLMLISSIDIILIKHLIEPTLAGQYALLTIFGKIILLGAGAFTGVTLPYITAALDDRSRYIKLVITSFALIGGYSLVLALVFNLAPMVLGQLLIGERASLVVDYLPRYSIAVALLAISTFIIGLQMVQRRFAFALIPVVFSIILAYLLWTDHSSLLSIIIYYQRSALAMFLAVFGIYILIESKWHFHDLYELLRYKTVSKSNNKTRILIFNWRDKKHVWSGGAEVYIHELAKRWVNEGHQVTLFCGNDRQNPTNQYVDGIQIIRRGGFVSVYIWAWLYYVLKLRHQTDIIVDCENGIPFFTPLYANKPIILLIHHVHLEVFKQNLSKPLASLAIFLETKVMPWVYRHAKLTTISESSKHAIGSLGFSKRKISIIVSGVDEQEYTPGKKSTRALVAYVGRLKAYKNIPTFLRAAKHLLLELPHTQFIIAGMGEEEASLKLVAKDLGIAKNVKFLGKVSQAKKISLYQKSWVTVNPSFMEGFGITSIESSSCGTPVVASDVPGLRDSVKHGYSGFLTTYGDSLEMSKRLFSLLTHRHLRTKMSQQAVKYAQNFDWQISADEFLKIIKTHKHTSNAFSPKRITLRLSRNILSGLKLPRSYAGGKNA